MNPTYKKIIKYVKPYKFLLIFSLLSSLLYVIMNSASIWIVGSLISKLMLPNHSISKSSINNSTSINLKLNELTDQIIGNGDPIIQLKSICILLFIIYFFIITILRILFLVLQIITFS